MLRQIANMLFGILLGTAISISIATRNGNAQDLKPVDSQQKPTLETIRDVAEKIRACWVPPPLDQAYQGMSVTVRFILKADGDIIAEPRVAYATEGAPAYERDVYRNSVIAAFARCRPLALNAELRRTIVGKLIWLRFVDDRKIGKQAHLAENLIS
jgi:hypothetical protein